MIQINKDSALEFRIGWIEMDGILVSESNSAYEALEKCAASFRSQYGDCPISQVTGVENARHLFHAIGIDPTKRRPSSEALLRRALKNKPLYAINTLVDVCNWCSLDFLLPICLYDVNKIQGEIRIGLGSTDSEYEALNGSVLNLQNRYCLSDDLGAFGSPITDSKRTAVDVNTTQTLFVIFAPDDYSEVNLKDHLEVSIQRIQKLCGGEVVERGMI